jgi:hypothetical protein
LIPAMGEGFAALKIRQAQKKERHRPGAVPFKI